MRLAVHDPHFRGAVSVAANRFGQGRTTFSPVNHAALQNAHFATGNLPVTPTRASLSASGRPASASTMVNRGGNRFFSPHGTSTAASGRSFEREQAQFSRAMRQNGVSPVNGNGRGFGGENNARRAEPGFHGDTANRGNSTEGNREIGRSGNNGANEGRGFNQPSGNVGRSPAETRGSSSWGSVPKPGNSASSESGREGGTSSGGWQRFSPMQPRSSWPSEGSTGRSNSNGMEGRSPGGMENRGSYGTSRSGAQGRVPEGRTYGGGGVSRPPLNMRQPIVTPRSSGGYPGGGRAPSFGRSAPGTGGGRAPSSGGRAPSFGGGGHSVPSGHSGGAPHSSGGSHSGGGGHGHR